MSDHHVDIDKHVRGYLIVFGALLALTVITVAVSYLHLPLLPAVLLALLIACTKGSLVALYFMHLIDERKLIYWVLSITVLFFFFVLLIPMITNSDHITL